MDQVTTQAPSQTGNSGRDSLSFPEPFQQHWGAANQGLPLHQAQGEVAGGE